MLTSPHAPHAPSAERLISALRHIDDIAREILIRYSNDEDFPDFPPDDFDAFGDYFNDHTESYAASLPGLTTDEMELVDRTLLAQIHYILFQERTF